METDLIGKADADSEEDASKDEHEHILGGSIERGADEESDPSAEHRPPAPEHPRHRRSEEGGDERRQVQRRREGRQQLAVERAVLVVAGVPYLFLEHVGEELLQERVHLSYSTYPTPQHHHIQTIQADIETINKHQIYAHRRCRGRSRR